MKVISTATAAKNYLLLLALLMVCHLVHAQIAVTGNVNSGPGLPLAGFAVLATGTETKVAYTDNNGNYAFELQAGGSYEIKPLDCEENPLNGVSSYDMVLINQHFYNQNLLDSPYKIIAADADNSGAIWLDDSLVLRNLILGIITDLPADNWRFIIQEYVFPDPTNPFDPAFPQSFHIANLQTPTTSNFRGIKVGDVNGSAILDMITCDDADLPYRISGKIFQDQTPDCQYNAGEQPLVNWKVSATNNQGTFYGTTNQSGQYEINVLPGTYQVTLLKPNNLWDACQDVVPDVEASLTGGSIVDFAVQAVQSCPSMEVELSAGILRRCFTNYYSVQYCNQGTVTAEDAHVEVDLDPLFVMTGSNLPYTHLGNNTYSFELGDVPAASCAKFHIEFTLSCDATLGQSHCTEARVFPDDNCDPALQWNGPDLTVHGVCSGNFVNFVIRNQGSDMLQPSNYIVVEDIIVMTPPTLHPINLASGGMELVSIPANGTTVRLEVSQVPGHPWSTAASATVEGCGTNANGGFSLGMVNLFPLNDQLPTVDIDCKGNIGSYDPNDKQGIPLGVLSEHFVPMEQPIEYLIRFQNTGTDTAFTVIVRDTLDTDLDPGSIRVAGASHPYTFNLSGEGVAQFVFSNIMLPDSNVNEAASHGFVKFIVAPKADVLENTEVNNRAGIYFDFNEPVMTNTTWHTFGSPALHTNVLFVSGIGLDVYPNPTSDELNFMLKTPTPMEGYLAVYNVGGALVANEKFEHNAFVFKAKELQAGYYLYKIISNGQVIAAGKLVKVD